MSVKKIHQEAPDYIKSNPVYVDTMANLVDAEAELVEARQVLDKVKAKKNQHDGVLGKFEEKGY